MISRAGLAKTKTQTCASNAGTGAAKTLRKATKPRLSARGAKATGPTSDFHDVTGHDVAGLDPLHCLPVLPVHFAHLGLVLLERLDGIFSIAFLLRLERNSYQAFLRCTNNVRAACARASDSGGPMDQCIFVQSSPPERLIHSQIFPLQLLIALFSSSSGHSTTIFGCVLTTIAVEQSVH